MRKLKQAKRSDPARVGGGDLSTVMDLHELVGLMNALARASGQEPKYDRWNIRSICDAFGIRYRHRRAHKKYYVTRSEVLNSELGEAIRAHQRELLSIGDEHVRKFFGMASAAADEDRAA